MTYPSSGTLAVRNEAQRILFEGELCGQISDGRWENSRPWNHWQVWSRAEVIVDPDNVGRDFYAVKDTYNFTERFLLDVVGDRMLASVQAVLGSGYTYSDMRADLKDLRAIAKTRRA